MPRMTRARTASYGLGNPPPLDRWIDAVLMLFAILVQGVAATFGMRFNHRARDWHTGSVREALPQTKPDIHIKDPSGPPGSRPAVDAQRRDQTLPQRCWTTGSVPLGTRSRRRPGSSQRAQRAPHTHAPRHRCCRDTHSLSSRKRAALSGTHCSKCPCIPMATVLLVNGV